MESTAVIQKFRTALGGFNRQDVQQYIEQTAAAHRQELAELQLRLDEAEDRAAQLEAALSGAENAKSGAAAEEARPNPSWRWPSRSCPASRPRWASWSPWRTAMSS